MGVAIASDGSSIPADIYGKDADKVKTDLTNRGYEINYVAHLASRQNVGKVVGTSPTPGVTLHPGQKVTLYYGVDSKGLRQRYDQLVANSNRGSFTGSAPEELYSKATVGRWCRNNGECLRIDDTDSQDYAVILSEGAFGQAADYNKNILRLYPCENGAQSASMDSDQNSLWKLGFGAYELIPTEYLFPWCGSTLSGIDVDGCQNGQVATGEDFKGFWSGAKWKMQDYLMVFPAGSQLKQVIDTGMFSSDELQKANKLKPVDGDRPFILHQDPKLYPETQKSADADLNNSDENSDLENPFLPGVTPREKGLMKPAPSDETAYYLVEELTVDWNTLTDVDLDSLGQTKGSKSQTVVPAKPLPSVETLMNSRIALPEGVCAEGAILDNDGTVQLVNGTWDINGSNSEIGGNLEVAAPMKVGNRELLAALFTCDQGSINTYSYVGFYDADLNKVPLKWESYTTLAKAIDNAGLAEGNHGTPILDMQVGTDTIHLVYGLYEKSLVCACPFGQFPVDYSWDGKQWKLSNVGQFIPPDLNY